jgi:hypothetical protein
MRNSVAAIALVALLASVAHAKPGGNGGQGQGRGNGQAEGGSVKRGGPSSDEDWRGGGKRKGDKPSVPQGSRDHDFKRGGGKPHGEEAAWVKRGKANRGRHDWDDGDHGRFDRERHHRYDHRSAGRGLAQGCPPGLAKKFNGCMPPGLAKKRDLHAYHRSDWWGFSSRSRDNYYYRDGFLLRLGKGDRINAYIPLLGGGLRLGNPWPDYYEPRPLPRYYERYYGLGRGDYRYADNVIYRMDPKTTAIMSVAALLTGDKFQVGQRMPSGYGVYNVPYSYRDRYYDRPDAHYRYADGKIYEINPKTMLIASVISLAI